MKWQKEKLEVVHTVCYGSEETGHACVMPPEELAMRLKAGKKSADIVISFINFPDSLKAAVEYAAGIWEMMIHSSVPIYMEANWQPLSSRTLGNCGASGYYINFDGAPVPDTYYPVALMEKLMEKEMTGPGNPDMIARFNSTVPWYRGTDGKTPSDKYDLASTVLHEIVHGLGFIGFFQVRTTSLTGYYGNSDNYPAIYDRFVEDYPARRLTDGAYYRNPSGELYKALTSSQLYSGSPVAYSWTYENRPSLYAPASFSNGSSIYHLNDSYYPYGSINALMTSSAGKGEAIHYPGPMTAGILADLGWKHLFIRHQPLKDVEEINQPLLFSARVDSEIGLRKKTFFLVYSFDGFSSHRDSVMLEQAEEHYETALRPDMKTGKIDYFLTVSDSTGRRFSSPPVLSGRYYSLKIGPDLTKPVIRHEPVKNLLSFEKSVEIKALVTDNLGVDSVKLVVVFPGLEPQIFRMEEVDQDTFRYVIDLSNKNLAGGDSIVYTLVATDRSGNRNTAVFPDPGQNVIRIEGINPPTYYYATGFSVPDSDFITDGFNVSGEKAFDNPALHSLHPYPSPDRDNASFNFYAMLRYPILVADSGKMRFDEVVLVEPGETGAEYGSEKFWDYVIVEGSKDYGKTWLPLVDGYDSGETLTWETLYNQKVSGNNSTSLGTKDHYIHREFSLTANGNFVAGDTILIRFRLYSDPYAHGWGWAIDNLEIQEKTTTSPEYADDPGRILLYPNPVGDWLNIVISRDNARERTEAKVFDLTGRIVCQETWEDVIAGRLMQIPTGHLPDGIYIVVLSSQGSSPIARKIVKK